MYQNIYVDREDHLVYIWDDSTGLMTLPSKSFNYCWVPDKNGTHLTLFGTRVAKKYNSYMVVGEKYESDLSQETRVLTDLYLNNDDPSTGHTIMFFDIETDSTTGFPNISTANKVITDISAYDSESKQYVVFTLNTDPEFDTSAITDAHVLVFETEIALLIGFLEYYKQVSPTILTGWNSDFFDIPYLYGRLKKICGYDVANQLSPIGKVKFSNFKSTYSIAGVSCLDYMALYKKFTYTEQPNYRLGTVAMFELGESKKSYEGSLAEFRVSDPVGFIEYNLQDVKLLVKFEEKLKMIELARGICHVGHVPYEDFSFSSRFLEGTIITYLHRQNIVSINKPDRVEEPEELDEPDIDDDADDEEEVITKKPAKKKVGFAGAFVKVPMPGLYEWVYSLDLQSLYPSLIMSLNISPETKMGKVTNWDLHLYETDPNHVFNISLKRGTEKEQLLNLKSTLFKKFLEESQYSISANGILYSMDAPGIIPTVLDKWFAERKKFKKMQSEAMAAGDTEMAEFYDRRQHIQKIFLNSMYGALGLPTFRFFDIDNALATTASGQDVIKHSVEYVNRLYKEKGATPQTSEYLDLYWEKLKESNNKKTKAARGPEPVYPDEHDHCVYIDTDSMYYSATPFFDLFGNKDKTDEEKLAITIKIANAVETKVNEYYNELVLKHFNCHKHRLFIKKESVGSVGLWITKKKYALKKVYDLEKDVSVEDTIVKGLDVVRSTFPPAFKNLVKGILHDLLNKEHRDIVDTKLSEFYDGLTSLDLKQIARNIAVKVLSKYDEPGKALMDGYKKGSPVGVKAALAYNRMLKHIGQDEMYPPVKDGDKIIYVFLGENEYGLPTMGLTGEGDCPEIVEFAKKHLDYESLFVKELKNKLDAFYDAMRWGEIPVGPRKKVPKKRVAKAT